MKSSRSLVSWRVDCRLYFFALYLVHNDYPQKTWRLFQWSYMRLTCGLHYSEKGRKILYLYRPQSFSSLEAIVGLDLSFYWNCIFTISLSPSPSLALCAFTRVLPEFSSGFLQKSLWSSLRIFFETPFQVLFAILWLSGAVLSYHSFSLSSLHLFWFIYFHRNSVWFLVWSFPKFSWSFLSNSDYFPLIFFVSFSCSACYPWALLKC